ERIPAAAGIVNLRYKSCPEMAGQDQSFFTYDCSRSPFSSFLDFLKKGMLMPLSIFIHSSIKNTNL
ncbi:hypothetical protein, partial [Enterobacter asburiae]